MEIVPLDSADEVAALAADTIEAAVRARPDAVLGLATGSTPLLTYRELIRRHRAGAGPSYDRVRCFTLDEYVGLPPGHPESYRATIARELTDPLGIPAERVHGPDPAEAQLASAGERYEAELVAAGGVDVQVLGIGSDGHLAFNEPGSSLGSLTRIKTLTDQTRQDNARFFGSIDEVPRHVLTQGLGHHPARPPPAAARDRCRQGRRRWQRPSRARSRPPARRRSSSCTPTCRCWWTRLPRPVWPGVSTTARCTTPSRPGRDSDGGSVDGLQRQPGEPDRGGSEHRDIAPQVDADDRLAFAHPDPPAVVAELDPRVVVGPVVVHLPRHR